MTAELEQIPLRVEEVVAVADHEALRDAVEPVLLPPGCGEPGPFPSGRGPGVSVELTIHPDHRERFYAMYLDLFAPLRTRAPGRQVLHRSEFLDEMADPRVLKYVAWNAVGEPVALSTLTADLATVPWISEEYFADRYPEQYARRAVYYWGFAISQGDLHSTFPFRQILVAIITKMERERAVVAYDICGFNNVQLRFAAHLQAVGGRYVDATAEVLDTQTYYGAAFD